MNPYLAAILLILFGGYFFGIVVEVLNMRSISPDLPGEFSDHYDPERYRLSQEYLKENTVFGLIRESVLLAAAVVVILSGVFNNLDGAARVLGRGGITSGLVFIGCVVFAFSLLNLPFSAYRTFVIEKKYGFNKTTPKTFALDVLKSWLLTLLLGGPLTALVLWIFEALGKSAWIFGWAAASLFSIFIVFVAPVVIMPLFNKFIPVEEGPLKDSLERYARSQDFRMKGLYKMDGSKRSTKSNAFFTGFGASRRIVLFDTLIAKHSVDELVSVLAHEMGHYKKGHIVKSVVFSVLSTGVMFFILNIFIGNRLLFDAFGVERFSIYASFVFFGFIYAPVGAVISVLGNVISRKHEYEADRYAVQTYKKPAEFINALKKLSSDNLSNLTPHPLKVFMEYSHPPVLERIKTIRKIVE
ncbi:MAG: M48 family metallopeptidase [Endomicrobiales bacterium]|nr:M48 family metallopeptidase [Endomicrobiales bacterium]